MNRIDYRGQWMELTEKTEIRVKNENGKEYTVTGKPVYAVQTRFGFAFAIYSGLALNDAKTMIDDALDRKNRPCLDPDKMLGAGDQFPGSDY